MHRGHSINTNYYTQGVMALRHIMERTSHNTHCETHGSRHKHVSIYTGAMTLRCTHRSHAISTHGIWTAAVTLTLNTAIGSLHKTLRLMIQIQSTFLCHETIFVFRQDSRNKSYITSIINNNLTLMHHHQLMMMHLHTKSGCKRLNCSVENIFQSKPEHTNR